MRLNATWKSRAIHGAVWRGLHSASTGWRASEQWIVQLTASPAGSLCCPAVSHAGVVVPVRVGVALQLPQHRRGCRTVARAMLACIIV
jgi:hypothetical protein